MLLRNPRLYKHTDPRLNKEIESIRKKLNLVMTQGVSQAPSTTVVSGGGGGGAGDMTKAVYDTNDDGRVDAADNATTIGASGYTIGTLTDTQYLYMDNTTIKSQSVAPGGYTDEEAQDAVGAILTDTATIDFTYTDATPAIEASVKAASITEAMQILADNTTNDVSITKHGYVPKAPNLTTQFLRGDGTWAALAMIACLISVAAYTNPAVLELTNFSISVSVA